MRDRMLRRQRQCRLEVGERAFRKSELGLRKPLVKAGLEMLRLAGKHDLQFGKSVARPVEAQQRVGVLIENVGIIGRERQRLVEALQRLGWALERVLGLAEIAPGRCHRRIDLDRRTE